QLDGGGKTCKAAGAWSTGIGGTCDYDWTGAGAPDICGLPPSADGGSPFSWLHATCDARCPLWRVLARMGAFDIANFKDECAWYKGKSTKKLLDGYKIHPGDPWAEENALIEKYLQKDFYKLREWTPTAIDTLPQQKKIRLIQAMLVHLAM